MDIPTNNNNKALLVNLCLSSGAEIYVARHRLSAQVGAKKRAQERECKRVHVPTELPFLPANPLVVGTGQTSTTPTNLPEILH